MTLAWYGHLKKLQSYPLWSTVLISWGIAFFEYCLQVPANRIGFTALSLPQLKIIQEILNLVIFAGFLVLFMGEEFKTDYLWAGLCLVAAVYFVFRSA